MVGARHAHARASTPQFRGFLGNASGFQSYQYRAVEFLLGNKNAGMLKVFESNPEAHELLATLLDEPSIYDEFLRYLARARIRRAGRRCSSGTSPRATRSARSWSTPSGRSTRHPDEHWLAYETCEEFVDLEDNFQLWRFRHMKTVQRIIGMKRGTGGSSGVGFLQKALDLTFFPELYAVRTEIR